MADITRRRFIRNASIGAAAAGTVAAAPSLLGAPAAAARALTATGTGGRPSSAPAGPTGVVAHVVDASSGRIAIYVGTREIVIHDPGVARTLTNAAR